MMKYLLSLLLIFILCSCVSNTEVIAFPTLPAYERPEKFRDFGYYEVSAISEVDLETFEEDIDYALYIQIINNTIYYSLESAMEIESPEEGTIEWVPILERYKVAK